MFGEVARDLQTTEEKYGKFHASVTENWGTETVGTESDETIARMLQNQFDKEYNQKLKKTEDKFNGTSKISISFINYRSIPQTLDGDSDSEEEYEDILDRKNWDRFDIMQKQLKAISQCGYTIKDGNIITKHDITLNSCKNACKFMSFPPEFPTGDGAGFDLQLSNKVFNSLKLYSKQEQNRRHRLHNKKEEQSSAEFGIDELTRYQLYKMMKMRFLERIKGVISIGKEAVILHAKCDLAYPERLLPKQCVIKIYKTTLAEFKQREKYIPNDNRFRNKICKQQIHKTIYLLAEKEMNNLMRMRKVGIPCPEVVHLHHTRHILIMSLIGTESNPAPKLKDVILSDTDWIIAYEQVVKFMKTLYEKAHLIHADLSEYNILWHEGLCYFIDVGQSIEPCRIDALPFLIRDCENITKFFVKKGVLNVNTTNELFRNVTGYDARVTLTKYFKIKPHLVDVDSTKHIERGRCSCIQDTQRNKKVNLLDTPV
ncbi:hypothetical protein FQA39_LY14044 [Lamprigera yunnana]|nr:hypothetical protein FQA39_LY14044 [Lamprigera yunnana]